MGVEHGGESRCAGLVVEHQVTAAIDLQVDQAGGQGAACQRHHLYLVRALRGWDKSLYFFVTDDYAVILQKMRPVEYRRGADGNCCAALWHGLILRAPSLPELGGRGLSRRSGPLPVDADHQRHQYQPQQRGKHCH